MPPKKKFRSGKRKKRRLAGNQYTMKENSAKKVDLDREEASESSSESEGDKDLVESKEAAEPDDFKSLPASVHKLKGQFSDSSEACSSEEFEAALEGFRLVNISVLASVFECLRCPLCKQGHVVLEDDVEAKMGLASPLSFKCTSSYTSKVENGQAFEVNRRVVLASRNIGVSHQGLVKFCAVMNILPPMNEN